MDPGKRRNKAPEESNKKMYMDLKDIVREHTLPFLPAKSLFKFRSVCWDWNRWIMSPFLAHNQSYFFHRVSGLFCQSQGTQPTFISLDSSCYGIPDPSLEFLRVPVDIKTSSNGLVCCQACTGDRAYYICNPATKQFKVLPQPNCHHGENQALVLVFEPSLLSFAAKFKLVCAFPSSDFDDGHEFEIYSSDTGLWELSGEICFGKRKLLPDSGVHAKGIVYWLSTDYIVAFDLAKDRSRLIAATYFMQDGYLGQINGELCFVTLNNRTISVRTLSNAYSNTLGMGTGITDLAMAIGSSHGMWTETHRTILNDGLRESIFCKGKSKLLFAGGNVVVAQVGEEDTLITYDMKTKQTAVFRCPVSTSTERYIPYVNSLVSLL